MRILFVSIIVSIAAVLGEVTPTTVAKGDVELLETGNGEANSRVAIYPPPKSPVRNPVALPIVSSGAGSSISAGAGIGTSVLFPPVRINIHTSSQLFVPPGSEGRLIVSLKNDGVGDLFFLSGGDDKGFFIGFENNQVQMGTGQTIDIGGRVRVPAYANNVVATLTVFVQRRTDGAVSQRRIYIRTKSEPNDRWAPWCTIRTVTKCDNYLDESICANRFWNMRAELQDTDSGLLSITIKPDGRFLGEDFPVGINDSVAIEQTVSCCTTGVDITATDVRGNVVNCRADQYTIYLTSGDIAAITLGVLLLILLIVLLIVAICVCCRRRKSVNTKPVPRSRKDQA